MFVHNWMSAPAVVIPPVVPAEAALGFMDRRQIRRLPVVDDGRLVGIVTRSDLMAALGKGLKKNRVGGLMVDDIMSRKPLTVLQEETLERAAEIMLE